MSQSDVVTIMQQALYVIILVSAPMMLSALVTGLIVSVFQATTQINEQTMTFVPKIVAVFISIVVFSGWILTKLTDFTYMIFEYIKQV